METPSFPVELTNFTFNHLIQDLLKTPGA